MSNKSFKIWYIAIVVMAFALVNLMMFNGVIKIGNWFKWVGIVVNCYVVGLAAWKIVTQHIQLEESK